LNVRILCFAFAFDSCSEKVTQLGLYLLLN